MLLRLLKSPGSSGRDSSVEEHADSAPAPPLQAMEGPSGPLEVVSGNSGVGVPVRWEARPGVESRSEPAPAHRTATSLKERARVIMLRILEGSGQEAIDKRGEHHLFRRTSRSGR